MKEQLIEFKTALLLKEKGFDIPVRHSRCTMHKYLGKLSSGRYDPEDEDSLLTKPVNFNATKHDNGHVSAPTQSLLQKWLREKHGIYISINADTMLYKGITIVFDMTIIDSKGNILVEGSPYEIYEKALEEGLYEALKLTNNE